MSKLIIPAMVAAALALTATSAVAQPGAGQQCFARSEINGFRAPDDRTVYIRVGVNDIYRLDLMINCQDLTFRQDVGLESTPPGEAFICDPLQAEVVYRMGGIPERCPVSAIHKLTPAELAALPKRDLP